MTYKDIYNDLKGGYRFCYEHKDGFLWEVLSMGDKYIYWNNYGSSAERISYRNLCWTLRVIFKMKANEFYNHYKKV